MARPEQVNVWIGLDADQEDHFAEVPGDAGERISTCGIILTMLATGQPCQPARPAPSLPEAA